MNVDIGEAEARLASLINRALSGEDIVLTRDGKPCVRLVPVEAGSGKRPVGLYAHTLSEEEVEESLKPLCP